MIKVVLIGAGNVAQHLILAFQKSTKVALVQAFARDASQLSHLLDADQLTSNFAELKDADVYIIAVKDTAIEEVSGNLPFKDKLVVHTSGSVAITDLNAKNRRGVFYPLQTFSKSKAVNFNEIPICLETENPSDYKILEALAKELSTVVYPVSSEQRKALHVAAVFVSNFTNHMYHIGNEICKDNNLDFAILKPLITETANKVQLLSPEAAQTGPARRNDTATINAHLSFLTDENQKEIYKLLTKSIIDHGKKL
jgi:predicted short-subunit dehydrogenase-like oxidoreductase (DUF2520 family)